MLEALVRERRRLVDEQKRITNGITSALKQYFPQALDWFADKDTLLFCDFIARWPTPRQVRCARRSTLETFFRDHNVHSARLIDARITAIKAVKPFTTDPAVTVPQQLLVEALAATLRTSIAGVARFDAKIAVLAPTLPDYALFGNLPGAGAVLAPSLLAAFGEQRERYPNAAALQRYVGIAPVTERSGNQHWVHWRWQCPTFLRQTFVEWAGQTIPHCFWAET
jgi:transposase